MSRRSIILFRRRALSTVLTAALVFAVLSAMPSEAHAKKKKWYSRKPLAVVGALVGGPAGAFAGALIDNNQKKVQEIGKHGISELKNGIQNIGEAAKTLVKMPKRVFVQVDLSVRQTEKQVKQGKYADAWFSIYAAPVKVYDKVGSATLQE